MTKKDYELIANALAISTWTQQGSREAIAKNIADALATENPRFNRALFLKACELGN